MTRRAPAPADLGSLSGFAAELAEAFVALSSDIALIIDDQGVIQRVAQSHDTPISPDAGGWVGRAWADIVSDDTRRKVGLMLTDLQSTGMARRREINVVGAAADGVPVAFSALRLGASGPVLAVGKDLRAVSAIQQRFLDAQQELERGYWRARQAESRYRLLFQVATDAVLAVDAVSLRVLEANHAAASLLGGGMSLAGRGAVDLFDRASRSALLDLLTSASATGKPAEIHARLPQARAAAAVSAAPFRARDGQRLLLRVRGTAPDAGGISDINRAFAVLVDSTRDGVVVTDSSGRIVVANPAFLSLVDAASEDDARGHAIGEWLGRIDADVSAVLDGAHEQGIAHLVRSSLRRRDGSRVDVDVTAALLAEGEQECFGVTIRPSEPRPESRSAFTQALATLEDKIGHLSLDELVARSTRLIQRRLMATAMSRAAGDAVAAAALLGIAVDDLMHGLADDDASQGGPAAVSG